MKRLKFYRLKKHHLAWFELTFAMQTEKYSTFTTQQVNMKDKCIHVMCRAADWETRRGTEREKTGK